MLDTTYYPFNLSHSVSLPFLAEFVAQLGIPEEVFL